MDDREVPTCRICRSEAEAGAPLFHPCRCTGSIRFCHQDCLIEWLQHSQKKHCELCGYAFIFRRHYARSMPDGRLPALLYARFAAWRILGALGAVARLVVAAIGWLVAVPHITYTLWHGYLFLADSAAALILHTPRPELPQALRAPVFSRHFLAHLVVPTRATWPTAIGITAALAVAFISVFLLREWIIQHMPHLVQDPETNELEERARRRAAAAALAQARAVRELQAHAFVAAHNEQQQQQPQPQQQQQQQPPPVPDDDDWATDDEDEWVDEGGELEHAEPPVPPAPAPQAPAIPELDVPDDEFDAPLDADERDWENDEAEQFEDDWNGVIDALGLRGPMLVLAQNLFVLQLLCITVSALFVMLPYLIGRAVGFKAYNLVLIPIDMLRAVTDPIFDALISTLTGAPVQPGSTHAGDSLAHAAAANTPAGMSARAALAVAHTGAALQQLTQGTGIAHRTLCVALGHAYALLLVAAEARLGVFTAGTGSHVARRILREYMLILKVFFFSALDLVAFPLACGLLLDWCMLPLFPGASLARRAGEAHAAPLAFLFFRWTSGTVFMFHTAQFIGTLRTLLRPGVMHWMRDPTDLDFQPVRDILSQPSGTQLFKLCESGAIYALALVTLIGANTRLLQHAFPSLFPLRWHPFAPLTVIPLDMLFIHFTLGAIIKRTRFVKRSTRFFRRWLILVAKFLRLSSFLLADEQLDEQGSLSFAMWTDRAEWLAAAFTRRPFPTPPRASTHFVPNGGFARVPADDRPARNVPTFIRTDAAGTPVDDAARDALARQLRAVARMNSRPRYTIVYTPPSFSTRLYAFVAAVWLFVGATIASLAIPLVCGRALLARTGVELHDMYAFMAGCAVLGSAAYAAAALTPLIGHGVYYRAARLLAKVPPAAMLCARGVYLLGTLGGVVPLLTGILLHQYILVPLQYTPDTVPTVNVLSAWALGLLSLNIVYLGLLTFVPDNVPALLWDMYDSFQDDGIRHAPLRAATRMIIVPVLGVLTAALLLPHAFAWLLLAAQFRLRSASTSQQQQALRIANAIVFLLAVGHMAWRYSDAHMGAWTRDLRDEIFLESTELCNFDGDGGDEKSDAVHDDDIHAATGALPDRLIRA